MPLASTVNTLWRVARDAVARLNRRLTEAEISDADLVFQTRRPENDGRMPDREPRPLEPQKR